MSDLGIKERSVGRITVLDTDEGLRIRLKFGRSSVPLAQAVESLLAVGKTRILLNLKGVQSLGARDLGELVSSYVVAQKSGGEFKLFNLTPMLHQMLVNTKLSAIFDLYDSEANATKSFSGNDIGKGATSGAGLEQIGN